MATTFTLAFIQSHQEAFDEYEALLTLAAQNAINGIESPDEYDRARRLQQVLKARRKEELTAKEAEALDGCLGSLAYSNYVPSVPTISLPETNFMLYQDGGVMLYEDLTSKMQYQ